MAHEAEPGEGGDSGFSGRISALLSALGEEESRSEG